MTRQIDRLDKKILRLISQNARIPFLEVARECNVSGAAIHQRIQKLQQIGVIKGSEFIVDTYKIGYQTCAYIGITLKDISCFNDVVEAIRAIPEVVECHYTTGRYAMFVKLYAKDNKHLLQIILDKLSVIEGVAHTETFQMSLDEIFHRQLAVFDTDEIDMDTEDAEDAENTEDAENAGKSGAVEATGYAETIKDSEDLENSEDSEGSKTPKASKKPKAPKKSR